VGTRTLAFQLDRWLRIPIRESTHRQYKGVLQRFAADPRGKLPITAITPAMVVTYGDTRNIKPGTWRNELQTLCTFFDWTMATPRRWIERSPLEGIKAPTAPLLPTKSAVSFAEDKKCEYTSLHELLDDLSYNEIKRDQLLNGDLDKRCLVTVTNVAVQQVAKHKQRQNGQEWNGVVVMTYEILTR
jgi:hypothetical protein